MKGTNKNTKGGGILKGSILWKEKIHVNENQKELKLHFEQTVLTIFEI